MIFRSLTLLFLLTLAAGALPAAPGGPDTAAAMVDGLRDVVYLQSVGDDELFRMYRILRADLAALGTDRREILFQSSRAAYYMARGYQALDSVEAVLAQDDDIRRGKFKVIQKSYSNLPDIIALYEEAMTLAEEYMEGGRDARGVRLYAEALSQLSTLKTLGFLMANGTKIEPLAKEAAALDSGEIKARMLLASRYVYSPGIWGGDPDRGIAMLEEISRMPGLDREDLHNISIGLGFAHTMAERWDSALPHFRRALEIYPGNVYALAMIRLCLSR
jgi:tetratricopeptide (TPR) repeat protein